MLNFNVQLHTVNENKTLNEAVEEIFSSKKPVVDLSFFYNESDSEYCICEKCGDCGKIMK